MDRSLRGGLREQAWRKHDDGRGLTGRGLNRIAFLKRDEAG